MGLIFSFLPLAAALVAIAAAVVAVLLEDRSEFSAPLIPLSGGLLAGLALFGLLPELFRQIGVMLGVTLAGAGCAALILFDRYIYPVCPSCSPKHDHEGCASHGMALHGFAGPLIGAVAFHAFTDGWALIAAQRVGGGMRVTEGLAVALCLHKIPEGLALGAMLRASGGGDRQAIIWSAVAESATVVGGLVGLMLTSDAWVAWPLAAAAGTFLFLGLHAIHGDWKRRGFRPAMIPALAGAAGAALLQWAFL